MSKIIVTEQARNHKYKFYCVYLAYHQREITGGFDPNKPAYPREFGRVRIYNNKRDQLEAYANTMCPASQCFEANSQEEINKIVEDFKNNFENNEWLEKNIYPYI